MKILYFTATGNNLYISKILSGQLDDVFNEMGGGSDEIDSNSCELFSIPQLIKNGDYAIDDDVVGFVFPVFYWGPPSIIVDFIKKLEIRAKYVFVIVSYGSFAGFTLNSTSKLLKDKGIAVDYLNSVKMVDNYVPLFDIDDELKIKDENFIDEQIYKMKFDIDNQVVNYKYNKIKTFLSSVLFNISHYLLSFDNGFIIDDKSCNLCGTCVKVCPKNNITVGDSVEIADDCIFCLACLHACPKKAIHAKKEKGTSHYRHPKIKLSEIIKSNNQNTN